MLKNKRPRRHRRTKAKIRIKKSDITSPTAATESVLIAAGIYATEGRGVSVIDAPGAFLMADMDEEVMVILENEMVDAIFEIDKEIYGKYFICEKKGEKTCTFASAKRCMER